MESFSKVFRPMSAAGIPERGEGREEVLHFQWGEGLQSSAKTITNPEDRKLVIFPQIIKEGLIGDNSSMN